MLSYLTFPSQHEIDSSGWFSAIHRSIPKQEKTAIDEEGERFEPAEALSAKEAGQQIFPFATAKQAQLVDLQGVSARP